MQPQRSCPSLGLAQTSCPSKMGTNRTGRATIGGTGPADEGMTATFYTSGLRGRTNGSRTGSLRNMRANCAGEADTKWRTARSLNRHHAWSPQCSPKRAHWRLQSYRLTTTTTPYSGSTCPWWLRPPCTDNRGGDVSRRGPRSAVNPAVLTRQRQGSQLGATAAVIWKQVHLISLIRTSALLRTFALRSGPRSRTALRVPQAATTLI